MDHIFGGFGKVQDATPEIQVISYQVKSAVEAITNEKYEHFTAVKHRTQIVGGTNYLIEVYVGGVNYIHLMVFDPLPCHRGAVKLSGVQQHKTKDDALEPLHN